MCQGKPGLSESCKNSPVHAEEAGEPRSPGWGQAGRGLGGPSGRAAGRGCCGCCGCAPPGPGRARGGSGPACAAACSRGPLPPGAQGSLLCLHSVFPLFVHSAAFMAIPLGIRGIALRTRLSYHGRQALCCRGCPRRVPAAGRAAATGARRRAALGAAAAAAERFNSFLAEEFPAREETAAVLAHLAHSITAEGELETSQDCFKGGWIGVIAEGVILKNSEGVLQLWMDEKSPCFRLCHHFQVSLQLWKETVLHALIDCWYKAKGSENCKPPSAQCHASDQNKIKAGPFPVVNLLISL